MKNPDSTHFEELFCQDLKETSISVKFIFFMIYNRDLKPTLKTNDSFKIVRWLKFFYSLIIASSILKAIRNLSYLTPSWRYSRATVPLSSAIILSRQPYHLKTQKSLSWTCSMFETIPLKKDFMKWFGRSSKAFCHVLATIPKKYLIFRLWHYFNNFIV